MEKLEINLKNCYGIQSLEYEFNLKADNIKSKHSAYAIYAPNGMMKTSFSRTFEDLSRLSIAWATDFIHILLLRTTMYLTTIIDIFSREIRRPMIIIGIKAVNMSHRSTYNVLLESKFL